MILSFAVQKLNNFLYAQKTQQKPVFLQTVKDRFSNLMTFKTNGSGITYWLQECIFAEKTSSGFLAEVKTDSNYSIL